MILIFHCGFRGIRNPLESTLEKFYYNHKSLFMNGLRYIRVKSGCGPKKIFLQFKKIILLLQCIRKLIHHINNTTVI